MQLTHYSKELYNLVCCIEIFLVLNIRRLTYQVFYDLMKYYQNSMSERQVKMVYLHLFEIGLGLYFLKIQCLLETQQELHILNPEDHKPPYIHQRYRY